MRDVTAEATGSPDRRECSFETACVRPDALHEPFFFFFDRWNSHGGATLQPAALTQTQTHGYTYNLIRKAFSMKFGIITTSTLSATVTWLLMALPQLWTGLCDMVCFCPLAQPWVRNCFVANYLLAAPHAKVGDSQPFPQRVSTDHDTARRKVLPLPDPKFRQFHYERPSNFGPMDSELHANDTLLNQGHHNNDAFSSDES